MATVTGLTAERMIEMEAATVIDGEVRTNDLILITRGGTEINAGNVRGPQGVPGPAVADGNKGDITVSSSGTNWQLNADAVTNAELADVPANTIKGGVSAGNPVDLTPTQAVNILPTPSGSSKGVVPVLPASGAANVNGFLGADGTFKSAPHIFATKALLNAWNNAPNGTIAVETETNTTYRRQGGVWAAQTQGHVPAWIYLPTSGYWNQNNPAVIATFNVPCRLNHRYVFSGGAQFGLASGTDVCNIDLFIDGAVHSSYGVQMHSAMQFATTPISGMIWNQIDRPTFKIDVRISVSFTTGSFQVMRGWVQVMDAGYSAA